MKNCDIFLIFAQNMYRGARWLSGRASDSGARGRGFEDTLLPKSTGSTQEAVAPFRHD